MKTLKILPAAACVTLWAAPHASATDLGLAPAVHDWTGPYLGITAGSVRSSAGFSHRLSGPNAQSLGAAQLDEDLSADDWSYTGGLLAGYGWQYDRLVFGLEADLTYLGADQGYSKDITGDFTGIFTNVPVSGSYDATYASSWYGTLRGRVGYAMDNTLFYATGGLAYADYDVTSDLSGASSTELAYWSGKASGWNLGWTLGAGVEFAQDSWVLGLEYLYVDLGAIDFPTAGDVDLEDDTAEVGWNALTGKSKFDQRFSVIRANLKYRF